MKIMVCGKGGCGKSTITSMLAFALQKRVKNVLVIDADESNYGLYRQLGAELPKVFTGCFGGRAGIMKQPKTKPGGSFLKEEISIDSIPKDYISESEGVKLMTMCQLYL
ncbi:MAG: P-loop NTPase [Lachnospiraceae bacterium]|nr:P-loop NTPase [Lachnospiraceae bacterium]